MNKEAKDNLLAKIRGCYIPVQIDSIQDNPQYNCFIVNDLVLLSYREASIVYSRNKQLATFYRVINNKFAIWCIVRLYNLFVTLVHQPEYLIIKQKQLEPTNNGQNDTTSPSTPSTDTSSTSTDV